MYGNTESAANILAGMLCEKGVTNISMYDVSCTHVSYLIADAFKYSHMALLSVTYNLKVFPVMQAFIDDMAARLAEENGGRSRQRHLGAAGQARPWWRNSTS